MHRVLLLSLLAAVAAGAQAITVYDNTTTFLGSGYAPGGAASVGGILTTNLLLDDLAMDPSVIGNKLTTVKFAIANFNTAAVVARMRLRFYYADGTSGAPGTALGGVSFAASSIGTGVTVYSADLTANNITFTSNNLWVGFFFDNSGASATTATQLNGLGLGIYNPPTVGSSKDAMFVSSAPSSFLTNNPGGTLYSSPFGANPVANFGFQFNVVPEPASMAAMGLGLLALARRRRKA